MDIIIAQGGEPAGFGGALGAMALVPQGVDAVAPLPVVASGGYPGLSPRSLRTPFVDRWNGRRDEVRAHAVRLSQEFLEAVRTGRVREYAPFTGQTAGLIQEVLPVAEIMRRLVAGAEAARRQSVAWVDAGG
ncbi:MAG TPA: hypothetical protein VIO14_14420 [Dehalococcoidia bacterium]